MIDTDDSAQVWLERIARAERDMSAWQAAADNIDKQYADLSQLRSMGRDREFQLFWSNIQVMGPSIYAMPPLPVVTPRFKDRRPLYRTASEFLERCCIVAFDRADIDQTMILLRDDLAIVGRGVAWVRYESDDDGDKVCFEHIDRRDFAHSKARKWRDVEWVARRAWMSREQVEERFGEETASRLAFATSQRERKDDGEKAGIWEVWDRCDKRVLWVADGFPDILEESYPYIKVDGFFPCPRPAYATLERGSLTPVPDMLLYKDQLEEVNALTRRIHALSESIRMRGFYAAGGDVGDAIERAIRMADDEQIMIPIPAMQALTQGSGAPIIWLPVEQVAATITSLVQLRRQVIDDVYQIMGLSDIMRGMTDSQETLGAQRIKQQNGSYRVRDKQRELTRVARDMVRISAEIMAEEYSDDDLVAMAQLDLPTDAEMEKQVAEIKAQARAALEGLTQKAAEMAQQAQRQGQQVDPAQAQEMFQQEQQKTLEPFAKKLDTVSKQVTIDAVLGFLRDEKLRPFVLDIETDSTVYPDEAQEKASRAEFMQAFAATMQTLQPMMGLGPEAVQVAGAVVKFALAPYRVGRELEGLIDDFADQGPGISQRIQEQSAKGPDKEMAQAALMLSQAEIKKAEAAAEKVKADTAKAQQEIQLRAAEAQAQTQADQQRFSLEVEQTKGAITETAARVEKVYAEIQLAQQKLGLEANAERREDAKAAADIQLRASDQAARQMQPPEAMP